MKFKYPQGYFEDKPTNDMEAKATAQKTQSFKGEASVQNEVEGHCPKCEAKMTTAFIAGSIPVHYCDSCRVSTPMSV